MIYQEVGLTCVWGTWEDGGPAVLGRQGALLARTFGATLLAGYHAVVLGDVHGHADSHGGCRNEASHVWVQFGKWSVTCHAPMTQALIEDFDQDSTR